LEEAIQQEAPRARIEALLQAWSAAQSTLIAALNDKVAAPEAVNGSAAPDAARQDAVVRRLAVLLKSDDSDAVELIEAEAATLRAALGSRRFEAMADASHSYDFDKALRELGRGVETADMAR